MWRLCACLRPQPVESEDLCAVCLQTCTSRACACMHLHFECAQEMVAHRGVRCPTCGDKWSRSSRLQRRPKQTAEEHRLIMGQTRIQRQRREEERRCVRSVMPRLVPHIVHLYPELSAARSVNLSALFEAFCATQSHFDTLYQRCLDEGMGQADAQQNVEQVRIIASQFEVLHPSTKRQLRHLFVQHMSEGADYTWENALFL